MWRLWRWETSTPAAGRPHAASSAQEAPWTQEKPAIKHAPLRGRRLVLQ